MATATDYKPDDISESDGLKKKNVDSRQSIPQAPSRSTLSVRHRRACSSINNSPEPLDPKIEQLQATIDDKSDIIQSDDKSQCQKT